MLNKLLQTSDDAAPAIARVALGLVMLPHAAQKVLGWFGGYGLPGTVGLMTSGLHLPGWLAYLAIAAEFLGALGLIVGLFGRGAAFGIAAVMVGAIATVHAKVGFFMNWGGQQPGEGFEYHLLALALAAIVLVKGSGAFSLDGLLLKRRVREATPELQLAHGNI